MNVELPKFRMSMSMKILLMICIAAGSLSLLLLFRQSEAKAWIHILIGCVLFLGLGLCGVFFTGIQFLTSAKWSVVIRRVMEAMAISLVIGAVLMAIVYFGAAHIYEWANSHAMHADPVLRGKEGFLNESAFGVRLITYFLIWLGGTFLMLRNSFRQDITGDVSLSVVNFKTSAIFLVLYALSVSLAGFDIVMSLEPHWFSTIFGVYFFAGFFQTGLGVLLILTWILYRTGVLKNFVTIDHFHDIARFLFGFSIFWAYIAFSQFMLIWYGNLPEEIFFFKDRLSNGWQWVSLALLCIRFIIPFFALMTFGSKRCFFVTIPISLLVVFGEWLDLYWVAAPTLRFHESVSKAMFGWKEIFVGIGFFALFLLVVGFILERIRLVPIKDPRLDASIHYYHH
jgi:hypothetical protein